MCLTEVTRIALTTVRQQWPACLQPLLASTFTNELPWVPIPVFTMSTPSPFTPEQLAWLQGNFSIKPPPSTSVDSASSSAGLTSITGGTLSEPASGECQGTMLRSRLSTVGLITHKLAQRCQPHRSHADKKPPCRRRRPPLCTSTHVHGYHDSLVLRISGPVLEWVLFGMACTCVRTDLSTFDFWIKIQT